MTKSKLARNAMAALAACAVAVLFAQAPAIKRTLLQRIDTPDGANHEAVTAIAEIAGGGQSGRHTHPGTESGYVLEGEGTLEVDGQPARPLKAGDSFTIPVEHVHNARSSVHAPLKVISTYVVEKGKPLASPAK